MKRSGCTMLEVLFGAALIAFGILGVFAALSYGARATQVTTRQAEGLNYGRKLFDLVRTRNLAFASYPLNPGTSSGVGDPAGLRRSLNAFPFELDLPAGTGLERNISCTRVTNDPSSYESELMRITVTIFYTEQSHRRQVQLQGLQARP